MSWNFNSGKPHDIVCHDIIVSWAKKVKEKKLTMVKLLCCHFEVFNHYLMESNLRGIKPNK